jgi:ABC-type glutathione transport system ATPase component
VTGKANLLEVEGFSVGIADGDVMRPLIEDISFTLAGGEILGIVGESGSGKTTMARGLTNLFPPGGPVRLSGSVRFEGRELLRTSSIRYVFQEPASALNPALRIGTQFRILQSPAGSAPGDRLASTAVEVLRRAGVKDPAGILASYPHQLSVGTLQRILISMALLGSPKLLIADEPTSAVDATHRRLLLELLAEECRTSGMGMILTAHDLSVARSYADTVAVFYAGRIVEISPKEEFFKHPRHPYSSALLSGHRDRGLPGPGKAGA